MTHTFVTMGIPEEFFTLVRQKMEDAGYQHAIHTTPDGDYIDMKGIALVVADEIERGDNGLG